MLTREHTQTILNLMHHAKQHMQYPKCVLEPVDGNKMKIQLSIAGNNAKFPNSINITDGKPYGSSTFYGRIRKDGQVMWNSKIAAGLQSRVNTELSKFADDPAAYASMQGKAYGNCMFCRRELTNPQSLAVGYGPICAEHYNLPHGDLKQVDAVAASQIELDIAELDLESIDPNTIEPMTLEERVLQLEIVVIALKEQVYRMQTEGF